VEAVAREGAGAGLIEVALDFLTYTSGFGPRNRTACICVLYVQLNEWICGPRTQCNILSSEHKSVQLETQQGEGVS
jgi:hypothetical protein